MSVPDDHTVCRFIRGETNWNRKQNRPTPSAFKPPASQPQELSVWSIDRLWEEYKTQVEDLLIDTLADAGQAHHVVADYYSCAAAAALTEQSPCEVKVEWRQDDEVVSEPWRRWRKAHVQVEEIEGTREVFVQMRRSLCQNIRYTEAPRQIVTSQE